MQVVRRWSIAPCRDPSGLAIDRADDRLYTLGASYGPVPETATKENPRRRAPIIPNSATVLVIER